MVASVTTTAVFLRWQAPLYKTSSVNFYRLEHRLSGSGSTSLGNLSIISTFVTLAGLTPGTMYELRMAAVSSIGAGPAVIIFAKTGMPITTTVWCVMCIMLGVSFIFNFSCSMPREYLRSGVRSWMFALPWIYRDKKFNGVTVHHGLLV